MKLPVIKHLTSFIEENDQDYVLETIETLEALTEVPSLKDEELDVKIYKAEKEPENHNLTTGTVIFDKSSIKVAVKGGFISILEIKLPGKRNMDVKSLLNGFSLSENAKML